MPSFDMARILSTASSLTRLAASLIAVGCFMLTIHAARAAAHPPVTTSTTTTPTTTTTTTTTTAPTTTTAATTTSAATTATTASTTTPETTANSDAPQGTITDYTDPSQAVPFGERSYWAQPWRAYMNTVPATTLQSAIGINFNVTNKAAPATAKLLGDSGFRLARIGVSWNELDYSDPSQLTPEALASLRIKLTALQSNGIRPLILLDADSEQPTPVQTGTLTLTAPAAVGAQTLQVAPSSLAAIAIGRTGITTDDIAAHSLITSVDIATDTVTLSRPLDVALPSGPTADVTLLYQPFAPPVTNGQPDPRFTQTLAGWTNYVAVASHTVASILGNDDFNVEVWNELGFGSQFLDLDNYYSPQPWSDDGNPGDGRAAILQATIAYLRDPANGLRDVGIGDGFTDESPYGSGSNVPVGLTAIDKHPYAGLQTLPADAPVNGSQPLNGLGQPSGVEESGPGGGRVWADTFTPTYDSFFPEYFLTSFQTESLELDLSPVSTVFGGSTHGSATAPVGGTPPQMWVTEANMNPEEGPAGGSLSPADISLIQAKDALRYYTAFVNKGVSALYLYAASAGDMSVVSPDFFSDVSANPGVYPGDSAGGEVTQAVGRLAAATTGATTITEPRQLSLNSLQDFSGGVQFQGNGTAAFPPLYNRDVVTFLPFQVTNDSFMVSTYVMTRNVEQDYDPGSASPDRFNLPPENYQMTIGGVDGASATVSATDPLTGDDVPVSIISRGVNTVTVQLPLTDSPRLLSIQDGGQLITSGASTGTSSGPTTAGSTTTTASGTTTTSGPVTTGSISSTPAAGTTPGKVKPASGSATSPAIAGDGSTTSPTSPSLTSLSLSRSAFTAKRTRGAKPGADIIYKINASSTLAFTVEKIVTAPGAGGHSRTHHAKRVTAVDIGTFHHAVDAGSGSLMFTGRIGDLTLAPGSYVLRAIPRAGGRVGEPVSVAFKITR